MKEVSFKQGQSAAGTEISDTVVFEQGPELGETGREMSRRGQDSRVWWGQGEMGMGGGLSTGVAGLFQWH